MVISDFNVHFCCQHPSNDNSLEASGTWEFNFSRLQAAPISTQIDAQEPGFLACNMPLYPGLREGFYWKKSGRRDLMSRCNENKQTPNGDWLPSSSKMELSILMVCDEWLPVWWNILNAWWLEGLHYEWLWSEKLRNKLGVLVPILPLKKPKPSLCLFMCKVGGSLSPGIQMGL